MQHSNTTTPVIPADFVGRYLSACKASDTQGAHEDALTAAHVAEGDIMDAIAAATGIDTASLYTYGALAPHDGGLILRGEGDIGVLLIGHDGRVTWMV